jgi:glucose dehydrogenase
MMLRGKLLTVCASLALVAVVNVPAFAIDPSRLLSADQNPNDWLTNHGSYKSYHYSPADQINTGNVKNLEVAWTHFPERATRGIQSTPLAADSTIRDPTAASTRSTGRPGKCNGLLRPSSMRSS